MLDRLAKCGYLNISAFKDSNKALFIDRDGTLHKDKIETRKVQDLEFFDGALDLLKMANKLGYKIVIVTNQSGIGKGHYSELEMKEFNDFMIEELTKNNIVVSGLYYCPHTTKDNCQCKKPKDGMFRRASIELGIDLSKSIMVGDQNIDIYAGLNAGINKNYLVTTGIYKGGKYQLPEDLEQSLLGGKLSIISSLRGIDNLE